ncbi:MAG TPA: outer membrane protein assembly factor BamA [Holophagaceae bacterium]|nr:outer membrane protein assembly factor BamA [Holophagaceae bacterium]
MTHENKVLSRAQSRWWGGLLSLAIVAGAAPALRGQEAEPIAKIEVEGNLKLTPQTVIFRSGVKVGDDARSIDYSAIVERLWSFNAFDDIKVELDEEAEGGPKLTIKVKERPMIKELDFRGGTEVGITNLKDKIKEKGFAIQPDALYDPEIARKMKDVIVDVCNEKGFRNPVVDVKLDPIAPGVARLVFDVKEGGKIHLYKVDFKGNKLLSAGQLRRTMKKTRRHWWFSWVSNHDQLIDKNLEEDLQNVRKAYWRRGYKDAFVGEPNIEIEDRTSPKQQKKNEKRIKEGKSPKYDLRAKMLVPVLEGEQYFEGKFDVEGNKLFRTDFFRLKYSTAKRDNRSLVAKALDIKPSLEGPKAGTKPVPYDLLAVNDAVDKVKEGYSDKGYILFHADKKLTVREEDGVKKVDTLLKVDEGEPYTVRRIEFEGNTTTKDKVIRRSMLLKEGDRFSAAVFKDSMLRVSQLGYFDIKNQDPKFDLVPDKPEIDLTVKGVESGVNEVLFQGGYGQLFGFSLGASFSTRNLGGGGETLSLSYNGGKFQKNLSVAYTEPFVLDLPYSFTTSFSNGTVDYDASRVGILNAYRQFTRSIGLSGGAYLSNWFKDKTWAYFTTVGLGYNFRIIRIEGGSNYYFRDLNSELTSTLTASVQYNTVDHPFKPTRGMSASFAFEYGGWQFAGDRPFFRSTWDLAKYVSLGERHIFAGHVSYGYLRKLSDQELLPYELYRPGGENSIRGFRYGQVGSILYDPNGNPVVVGGNKQFIANFEYQFKVADQFRTVLFYDAGNAWSPGTKVFSDQLRRSFGAELRFFLPISPAPLRLIWSRKLNPYPFDTEGQNDFQFSIGTTF